MDDSELVEFLLAFLPETGEGWFAAALLVCAILAVTLPQPKANCHPALKIGHKIICILGMGASRLRSSGKLGKLGRLFRRIK